MKQLFVLILFFSSTIGYSQYTSIRGKVIDAETEETLLYANMVIEKNGVFVAGAVTDFDGNYSIPLDPGTYDMHISYTGYENKVIEGIVIVANKNNLLNISMNVATIYCGYHRTIRYKIPLIEIDAPSTGHTVISDQIRNQGTKTIDKLILNTPGVSITNF